MVQVSAAVLGPLRIELDGVAVGIPGPKQRVVLALLVADANRVVSSDRLVDALWGDDVPRSAEHAVQQHVSVIRKQLEAAGEADPSRSVLVTQRPGYLLRADDVDVVGWERSIATGLEAAAGQRWEAAIAAFDGGLARWRGSAFEDVEDSGPIRSERVRLEEQRLAVQEARADALLSAGRAREVVAEMEGLVAGHPLRERFWGQLMLALYRSGRQADALAARADW